MNESNNQSTTTEVEGTLSNVHKTLEIAFQELGLREKLAERSQGIFLEVFLRVVIILDAVKEGKRKKTIAAIASLESLLSELQQVLSSAPFGNPSTASELQKVADKLREVNTDCKARISAKISELQQRILILSKSLEGANAQKLEQQERLSTALEKLSEKTQSLEKMQECWREVQAQNAGLRQKLEASAMENSELRKQLTELQKSPEESLPLPNQFLETLGVAIEKANATGSALTAQTANVAESLRVLSSLQQALAVEANQLVEFGANCSTVAERLQKRSQLQVPAGLEECLGKWLEWQSDITQAIRTLSESVDESEPALQEALARESIHLNNGDSRKFREELEGKIQTAQELIEKLIQMKAEGEAIYRKLKQFAEAVRRVEEGLGSEDLKDPPLVPEVEPYCVVLNEEDQQEDNQPTRREFLEQIAAQNNVLPHQVLMITLYELIPGDRRGILAVLLAADRAGLLQEFGWSEFGNFYEEMDDRGRKIDLSPFLVKMGTNLFSRTPRLLPWNVQALISSEEAERFKMELASSVKK